MVYINMAYSPISYDNVRQGIAGHWSQKTDVSHIAQYLDVWRLARQPHQFTSFTDSQEQSDLLSSISLHLKYTSDIFSAVNTLAGDHGAR